MIGGASELSHMQSSGSEEISHMFFGASRRNFMFATHPPLIKRIRKIDEHFDGDFKRFVSEREERRKRRQAAREQEQEQKKKAFDFIPGMDHFEQFESMKFPINPIMLIAGIGIPTEQDVEFSELMVNEIPTAILIAARETFSARCIVFASLLDPNESVLQKQIAIIQRQEIKGTLGIDRADGRESEAATQNIATSRFRNHSGHIVCYVAVTVSRFSRNGELAHHGR